MKTNTFLKVLGVAVIACAVPVTAAITDCSGIFQGRLKRSNGVYDDYVVVSASKGGRVTGASYLGNKEATDVINPAKSVVRSDNTTSGATFGGGTYKGKYVVSSTSGYLSGTATGDYSYTFKFTRTYK